MKIVKVFICALLGSLVMYTLGSCATAKYVPKPNEELYGIWTNEHPSNLELIQKQVFSVGSIEEYRKVADSVPLDKITYEIDSKWTDSGGNIWYRFSCKQISGPNIGVEFTTLSKLSESATVLEYVFKVTSWYGIVSYPTQIDAKSDTYHVFNRARD
jgi:hypothetical protein